MLEIVGREARVSGDAGQHARPELFIVVKAEDEVRLAGSTEGPMRARAALEGPANPEQGGVEAAGFGRPPRAHAA
jgi:hypothetical protein